MKKEDYRKAEPIIKILDNINKLIEKFSYGSGGISNKKDFSDCPSDDFKEARFYNIKNHDTIGTPRISICEHRDMSGAVYHLTKQETIELQDFISEMLADRLIESRKELESI